MTIGIIEDDTLLHQALKTALQNAGYQTVSAYTKQEALTTITGSESLLLIDIGLPDGNGLACYKKIREKAEIPAIFLTARDEETDMLTAFDRQCYDQPAAEKDRNRCRITDISEKCIWIGIQAGVRLKK